MSKNDKTLATAVANREICKLGTTGVKDKPTGLVGMLTGFSMDSSGADHYVFLPFGLNPETGEPVESFWVSWDRLKNFELFEPDFLPVEVLGTKVTDTGTGYTGTAVGLNLHTNGCVHIDVQSKGQRKDGSRIAGQNFDIRRLKGKAVPDFSDEAELAADRKKRPSPEVMPARRI